MLKTQMNRVESQPQDKKKDYSKINYSKTQVLRYCVYDYEKEIKKIKYPTYSISNAENLLVKIQSFQHQNVRNELKKQLVKLNSYRKIRGDGNCFFRALAFGCLASVKQPTLKTCFPFLNSVCLTCCLPESIPADFKKFYDHDFLLNILAKDWSPVFLKFYDEYKGNAKKTLIKVFDQYPFLDFIVILYFRAVCLKGLWTLEEKLKQFLLGNEEKSIRTYSEETEGVSINICSITLNLVINVYQIRKGAIKVYHYDDIQKRENELNLLFYENHYDVIEHNEQIDEQKNSLSTANYYSDLNKKMVKGVCLQCNKEKFVFEDSSVCTYCFDLVEIMAKKYDNSGKHKRGRCQDCRIIRDDIIEDLGICEKCIAEQNQVQQRRRKRQQRMKAQRQKNKNGEASPQKRKQQPNQGKKSEKVRGRCVECQLTFSIDSETGLCSHCQKLQKKAKEDYDNRSPQKKNKEEQRPKSPQFKQGRCIQCKYTDEINCQTNLCSYCSRAQQRELNRLKGDQQRKQMQQKIMRKTNQKVLDSVSPKKQNKIQSTKDNDNYYNKYMIGGSKNSDSNKVGTQIKQDQNQKKKNFDQSLPEWQRDEKRQDLQKDSKKSVLGKCEKCRKEDILMENAPICLSCYKKVFNVFNLCKICVHRLYLHEDTLKCSGCHYKEDRKPKPTNQIASNLNPNPSVRGMTPKKTSKCNKCNDTTPMLREGLCQSCYSKCYCMHCKQVKFVSYVLNGKCSNCRSRGVC